jgi:hypothetical protein
MIIHNDTQKSAHAWQNEVIDWIFNAILSAGEAKPERLRPLFNSAFEDLAASVAADKGVMPPKEEAFAAFIDTLQSDDVVRETVNSDKDVMALLDDKAELKLRTPFNIYIGGNILDRGITIPNLIAFYYGRNPHTMQADTVLQHSRMYGNREKRDLAVTRLYTSVDVYDRLYTINSFETTLRQAFETGAHDKGVVFIQTDAQQRVRPCAPNKIMLSNIVSVRPGGLLLPTGFVVKTGRAMKEAYERLEGLIRPEWRGGQPHLIEKEVAKRIIETAEKALEFEESTFDWDAMIGLLDYYTSKRPNYDDGKLLFAAEIGRRLDREKSGDKSGLSIVGGSGPLRKMILNPTRSRAALILLRQEGTGGWGGHRFWWPILAAPSDVEPCVFAGRQAA